MAVNEKIKVSPEIMAKVSGGWEYGQKCPYCTSPADQMLSIGKLEGSEYFECQCCHVRLRNPINHFQR